MSVFKSSGVKAVSYWIKNEDNAFCRHAGKQLTSDSASHYRITEFSTKLPSKTQISQNPFSLCFSLGVFTGIQQSICLRKIIQVSVFILYENDFPRHILRIIADNEAKCRNNYLLTYQGIFILLVLGLKINRFLTHGP